MAGTRTIVLSLRLDLDYPSASVFSPSSFLSPWAFRSILLWATLGLICGFNVHSMSIELIQWNVERNLFMTKVLPMVLAISFLFQPALVFSSQENVCVYEKNSSKNWVEASQDIHEKCDTGDVIFVYRNGMYSTNSVDETTGMVALVCDFEYSIDHIDNSSFSCVVSKPKTGYLAGQQ